MALSENALMLKNNCVQFKWPLKTGATYVEVVFMTGLTV